MKSLNEKGKKVSFPYRVKGLDDKVIVNIVMFFTIPETEEEFYYSYLPEIIKEKNELNNKFTGSAFAQQENQTIAMSVNNKKMYINE